ALKTRAQLEVLNGNPSKAQRSAHEGHDLLEDLGDAVAAAHLRRVLGEALELEEDWDGAFQHLQAACRALRRGEDVAEELAALEALGRVCRKLKKKSQALRAVDRGQFLAQKFGYPKPGERLLREREEILLMPGTALLSLRIDWTLADGEDTVVVNPGKPRGIELMVTGEIGRGGFGVVYRVKEKQTGKEYALKQLLKDERAEDDTRVARFRSEAYAAARVRHPNIVEIYQIEVDEEQNQYLLMELLPGGSLERTHLDWREAFAITANIADALSSIHSLGIVHRDLKPGNILRRSDGTPVLTDFGVAHLPGARHTVAGEMIGSLEYLPPEAFADEPAKPGWDMFALGVTLYELMQGIRPYPAGRVAEGIVRFPDAAPRRPRSAELPEAGQELMLRLVARDPQERPDAARARDEIRGVLGVTDDHSRPDEERSRR
ncbi:MAG: serine/threonine-protein kinase, partial [Planctomycetota bacterium]